MSPLGAEEKRRRKWVWGCTGGCLAFIVTVGAVVVIAVYLLMRSVPVVPPETFVTPEAAAFLFVRIEPEDPLMVETAVRLASRPELRQRVRTKDGEQLSMDAARARDVVLTVAPIQLVGVLRPGDGEERFHRAVAVCIHKASRFFTMWARMAVKSGAEAGSAVSEYKGAAVLTTPEGKTFAVRRNNYLWADRAETVRAWVDRLEERRAREEEAAGGEEAVPPLDAAPTLKAAYERLDRDLPIRFACGNAHGELRVFLALLPKGPVRNRLAAAGAGSEKVVSVAGQMQGLNNRDAALRIYVDCADSGFAQRLLETLEAVVAEAPDSAPLKEVRVKREEGTVLKMDARIENLPDKIFQLIDFLREMKQEPAE
ncbi:MAG: hypothetical protein KAX44_05735 [Candidatus Brocadiae bacterium]|nr:hypothetical protein [Candidatus Brocadiia bacterium]